ncbi:MAG TPA: DUF3105 domain-containing protein [Solirubrobacteraceae bacterium]|nr:DUF3105 domain-containing protein [Solirubrobacteraceae bacterium]
MPTDPDGRAWSSALLRYALVWIAGGAVVAALLITLVDGGQEPEIVPLRETQLEDAARHARCDLYRARPGQRLDPPVDGPARAQPLRPGVYDRPERLAPVIAALRRGAIVVHYRPGLDESRVEQLEQLQTAVPEGTIVLPARKELRYELAVTAWRRLLGCARFTDRAIDALRLFRGRFIGRGPDAD